MAATGLQKNWSPVAWGNTTITKVTSVDFDQGGNLLPFYGDGNIYPTVLVAQDNKPTATVQSGDIGGLQALGGPGTTGTLTATHLDAKLAAGGAINYTLNNAVIANIVANGPRGQFGSGTLQVQAFSSDGTTNPLSFTRT